MSYIPNAALESAQAWVERPEGDMWFTHVPVGKKVIISPCGEKFHFDQHPQLKLNTSNIPLYVSEGRIRVCKDA
jgi:hypothetical protein